MPSAGLPHSGWICLGNAIRKKRCPACAVTVRSGRTRSRSLGGQFPDEAGPTMAPHNRPNASWASISQGVPQRAPRCPPRGRMSAYSRSDARPHREQSAENGTRPLSARLRKFLSGRLTHKAIHLWRAIEAPSLSGYTASYCPLFIAMPRPSASGTGTSGNRRIAPAAHLTS